MVNGPLPFGPAHAPAAFATLTVPTAVRRPCASVVTLPVQGRLAVPSGVTKVIVPFTGPWPRSSMAVSAI
ncbi:hypothetical protein ACU4GR_27065 [Methylobacterium oryzae CBMB20]